MDMLKEFRRLENLEGNGPIHCSRMHFGEWADEVERRERIFYQMKLVALLTGFIIGAVVTAAVCN